MIDEVKKLEELGWVFDKNSEVNWYLFKRGKEILTIDFDKKKITHYTNEEDTLNELSFETLYIILKMVKLNAIY
jgi:hypothetical protein